MTSIEEVLVDAIAVRDMVASGLQDRSWTRAQIIRLVEAGWWSDGQVAAITGYTRQAVGSICRDAVRPSPAPQGGTLASGALDLLLTLRGATSQGEDPNASLLSTAIATGTSTKLISRLTGIRLGQVLYCQRKMKENEEVESWMNQNGATKI